MRAAFAAYGLRFIENNLRSARLPEGVEVHPNEAGTAPAFSTTIGRCRFFFLPGVPAEFNAFVRSVVVPWVASHPVNEAWVTRILRVLGLPESHVAENLNGLAERHAGLRVGYRARAPEVWVKLSRGAPTREEAFAGLEAPMNDAAVLVTCADTCCPADASISAACCAISRGGERRVAPDAA